MVAASGTSSDKAIHRGAQQLVLMKPLIKVPATPRRIQQQHVHPPMTHPLNPMHNIITEETAVAREHRRMVQQHIHPPMTHPLNPMHNIIAEEIAVAIEHGIQQSTAQVANPTA